MHNVTSCVRVNLHIVDWLDFQIAAKIFNLELKETTHQNKPDESLIFLLY